MALDGMLTEITQASVTSLLIQRHPEILEDTEENVEHFEDRVGGAAVEVALLTGLNPAPGPLRTLAIEAVKLETASQIEYAEYPEQQLQGRDGRGYYLHQRYLELLARLREFILGGGTTPGDGSGPVVGPLSPSGDFPIARAYPDPADWPC